MGSELDLEDVVHGNPLAEHQLAALRNEINLLTHKVITCGVAASHPDPELSLREKDYGGKWDSPQAEKVRELRRDRDRIITLANDALSAWDSDQDSRTGKLLMAIVDSEFRQKYRPDLYA